MRRASADVRETERYWVGVREGLVLICKPADPGERLVKTPGEAELLAELLEVEAPLFSGALRKASAACRQGARESRT